MNTNFLQNSVEDLGKSSDQKYDYKQIIEDKIQHRKNRAQQFLEQGDFEQAIFEYSKIIFLNPKSSQSFKDLGNLYKHIQDYTMAINMYKKSFSLDQDKQTEQELKQLLRIKGMMLLEQGEINNFLQGTDFESFQFALQFDLSQFKIKSDQNTNNSQKHFITALCYLQLNYKKYALEELDAALQIDKNFIEAILLKGKILWSQNNIFEGNLQYWFVENQNPNHPEIKQFLDLINPQVEKLLKQTRYLLVQNEIEQCLLIIKQGLELFPNNTQFLIIKQYILRKQGDYEQALSVLILAIQTLRDIEMEKEIKNQLALTYNEIGILEYKQGFYQEAIQHFQSSLEQKSNDWSVYVNLGDCYRQTNMLLQAKEFYNKAKQYGGQKQEINQRLSLIHNSLGIQFFNKNHYKFALQEFNDAIQYAPNFQGSFYQNRAKCYQQLGKQHESFQDYLMCNKLDPTNYEVASLVKSLQQKNINAKRTNVIPRKNIH
ncbi:hypothetical protein PPERSA_04769 [Pseudocohnilembus persalinus]|uniref:Uncharacterized protein n=1 Tax=Pseudocohnilembus persalinus TaxID=266149 RepID=A0A0V0QNG2_PSEPJ|nr:hypothetical protein PPERSA_04769 [Pseudocohnilembus persalinus]|eukprot:KRX03891.1 hypothetical protein PPERSA_04769 [Pseudocohnilembus persalinus]